MGIRGLAEYFIEKYAGVADLTSDDSFGAPINSEAVRILKDALVNVYSKIEEDITKIPAFDELNKLLVDNSDWNEFHRFLINHVNYIESNDLKKGFNYSIKLIERLTDLRYKIAGVAELDDDTKFAMTEAVRIIGDHIWYDAKQILNIHNLRGLLIRLPDAERILNELQIKPTWPHGPMKNPNPRKVMKMRQTPVSDLTTRLKLESLYEDARKKLGPYAEKPELDAAVKQMIKDKRNATARKSEEKRKNKGGG